jgi:molecular chaperone GrpE
VIILPAVSTESPPSGAEAPDAEAPETTENPTEAPAVEQDPLVVAQGEAARLKDQLLRTLADFDNFRKRTRRDIADAERRAREDLLKELLPVFDNLERAAQHAESATEVQALADGIGMVMRQFADTLGKVGVERVAALGLAFDPSIHEAVQSIETSDYPPGAVAAELQAGYRLGERVIRPAMVVVAKAKSN